jgi:ribonuclease BN (tRNA processing enzyme)
MKISSRRNTKVRLSNQGDLSLYFIGAGSAFAKTLNQNNLLIVKGNDHLLIDCGTKCSQALHEVGLPVSAVRNFLITHSHADHIGGLEEVQLFGRYVTQQKPNMIINNTYQKILWEQSLRGGSERSESKDLTFTDLWSVKRPKKLKDYPRETWESDIGSINIKMPRTMHFPDSATSWKDSAWSCGVIIDDRILYSSDTRFDRDLIESFDDKFKFDMIFHDCQLFTAGVHASIDELSTLPIRLKRKMVLMHYGDNWQDFKMQAKNAGFHSWAKEGRTYSFAT